MMLEKFSGEKRKQLFYLIGAVGGSMALMFILTSVFSDSSKPEKIKVPEFKVIGKDVEPESFRAKYGDELTALKAQNKRLEEELKRLAEKIEKAEKIRGAESKPASGAGLLVPPPPPPSYPPKSVPPPPKMPSGSKKDQKEEVVLNDLIVMQKVDLPAREKSDEKKKKRRIVIPANSFIPGYLLSGFDAPTGGKAQSNPIPLLIRISRDAILPNGFRADIKECFVGGDAYGDLSSDRAYARLTTFSCMTGDGEAVERKIRGYISGSDGKAGLVGRPVSKQGALLARTAMAGFLEGVAKAFKTGNVTYSVQPTGIVAAPKTDKVLETGLFGGAQSAASKLADFYMKLANEMYPVIEINAGRKVNIVLLQKLEFEVDE